MCVVGCGKCVWLGVSVCGQMYVSMCVVCFLLSSSKWDMITSS